MEIESFSSELSICERSEMFKTSRFVQEISCPASDSLTPIRDYDHDYFHKNDDKLPTFPRFPYGKPSNYEESTRGSVKSSKRPASLVLNDNAQPLNKKQNSPLNLRRFQEIVKLERDQAESDFDISSHINPKVTKFFEIVRRLYESELEYAELMEASNLIYRKTLNENRSFKNKLVNIDSHDELLIFGNIETISSISRLFLSSLRDIIFIGDHSEVVDSHVWDEIYKNPTLQDLLLASFDIGKVFNLNFLRIKSTYLTYFVTHQKQMELFDLIRAGNPYLFHRWYDHCLKAAGGNKLEDILQRPIKRLQEWVDILENLSLLSNGALSQQLCATIKKSHEQYASFVRYVENETSEFNGNAMYDFSLTPLEIIQSYGPEIKTAKYEEAWPEQPQKTSQNIEEKLPALEIPKNETENQSRVASVYSDTSSRYSGDSTIAPISESRISKHLSESENQSNARNDLTLADHVSKLKKIHKGAIQLQRAIGKEDMLLIIDNNLKHAALWKDVIECEQAGNSIATEDSQQQGIYVTSMYSAYIDKLQKSREEATMMKLTGMETSVKTPLSSIIGNCNAVRSQIRDLNALKKDYMLYLREKTSSGHDLKRDILGKHFENMQRKMIKDLPRFIDLVHKALEILILNYHKMMLKYLEISVGGELFLVRDLELLGSLKKDSGKNFDILQNYSASRYCSKRMVRENWQFKQDPTASRVVRKLFEL